MCDVFLCVFHLFAARAKSCCAPSVGCYLFDCLQPTGVSSDNAFYAFLGVPDAEIVQVASGPSDTVAVNDGTIKVTGENNATYKGTFVDDKGKSASLNDKLSDSYLVMCVSGSCEKGTFHLMSKDRIYGEVQNIKESK